MSEETRALIVSLEARIGQYERAMRRAQGQTRTAARGIENRFERMNRSVSRSFQTMSRVGMGALGALGVGLGAAAFTNLVRGSLDAAEALRDTATRVAFTVEQLQELRYAADQNGSSARTLDMALQRFTRRTGEAAQGTGELFQTIQDLGISLRNADGSMRSSYEILLDYADAIQNAESDQERLRLAFKAFDSEGAQLVNLMRQGRDGVLEFASAAREAGLVMREDLVKAGADANAALRAMRQAVGAQANEAILEHTDALKALGSALGEIAEVAINAAAGMSAFGSETATAIGEFGQFLGLINDPERDVVRAQDPRAQGEAYARIADQLDQASFNAREFLESLREIGTADADALADQFQLALESGQPFGDLLDRIQDRLRQLSESRLNLADMFQGEQDLRAAMDIITNPFRGFRAAVVPEISSGSGETDTGQTEQERLEALGRMGAAIAAKLAESEREFLDFLDTTEQAVIEARENSLALADRELERQMAIARARGDETLIRSLERELNIRRAIAELTALGVSDEKAQVLATQQADAFDIAERQGEFRETFRTAFSEGMLAALQGDQEAFERWIRDGATRGLEAALNNLADMLFNLFTQAGQGGKGGGLGGIVSGVGSLFGLGGGPSFGGAKAGGGPVSPGKFYTVGERGPETFVPNVPGLIVPNTVSAGAGAASRVQIVQEFHLHAEGAVMTAELLAEMDQKAANAGAQAVAVSRNDLTDIRRRQTRRLG